MYGLPEKELTILKKLNIPVKIQNFLDTMRRNFEEDGDTFLSPLMVLEKNTCHCVEGAVLAALALRVHGYPPLLVDLTATKSDLDHVIAVFQKDGRWELFPKPTTRCSATGNRSIILSASW
ncbi:MAG: hypothetical protein NTZ97_03005 [Candidatus Moranbacteria bacterium]|nr:hypothetical protein [Candidatus Moranbacteria bacterium]